MAGLPAVPYRIIDLFFSCRLSILLDRADIDTLEFLVKAWKSLGFHGWRICPEYFCNCGFVNILRIRRYLKKDCSR